MQTQSDWGKRCVDKFDIIGIIGEDVVLDDWLDLHVVIGPLQQEEVALQCSVDLTLEEELEGECTLTGQVGVTLRIIDPRLQYPCLIEHCESWRLIV